LDYPRQGEASQLTFFIAGHSSSNGLESRNRSFVLRGVVRFSNQVPIDDGADSYLKDLVVYVAGNVGFWL
jgi:hypothetical protein